MRGSRGADRTARGCGSSTIRRRAPRRSAGWPPRSAARSTSRRLFADVVADAMNLFSLARMGLWLYHAPRRFPFSLAAQHGLTDEVLDWVSGLRADAGSAGLHAIQTGRVVTLTDTLTDTPTEEVRDLYARNGIRSVCFAPMIFRDEPVGLLVLYQDVVHAWTDEETALAAGFANQMATAVGNARLHDSVRSLAVRLEAVQDLAVRLNRTRGLTEIAELIVEGCERMITYESIRVYSRRSRHEHVRADRVPGHVPRQHRTRLERVPLPGRRGRDGLGGRAQRSRPRRRRAIGSPGDPAPATESDPGDPRRPDQLREPRVRGDRAVGRRIEPVRARGRDHAHDLRRVRRPGDRERNPARRARPAAARARASAGQPAPPARHQRAAHLDPRPQGHPRDDRRLAQGDRPVRRPDDLPLRLRGGRPARRRRP